ncbi:unknown [Succinatimonas sp. CAG:777]|nr:unknown [Succinatimonas sp. CAG:777]
MACFTACVAEALVAYGVKKVVAKVNHQKVRAFSGKIQKLINLLLSGSFFIVN